MPSNNESTMKWKVDIAQLKAGMQEAKRSISLANAEFKNATADLGKWSDSMTGVEAKIKQLNSVSKSQHEILDDLQQEYAIVAAEMGETSPQAEKLKVQILNQEAACKKTDAQIASYTEKLGEMKAQQAQSETAMSQLNSTIDKQESEIEELKTAYANVVLEQGKNSAAAQAMESDIKSLSGKLQENKGKLDEAKSAANDLAGTVEKAGDKAEGAEGGFTVLKGALADLVSEGIQYCIDNFGEFFTDFDNSSSSFQASTGASADEMEKFNSVMADLYKQNYGESMQDVGDKMAYVKKVTGEVDPSKLGELTKNAIAMEDTFGSDFNETVRGVSNLMRHFGIDAETAFDLFAKGSQQGLDYTDELGDNVAEYGGNFAQAGYSADEYFQLLENGAQGGAYNLDKVNDSINEVKNRLGDGTIEKNIGMFSKGTQDAFKNWQNGKGTMKDVINSIVGDISTCTNEQEALTMAQTAFGTMGEDANLDVVKSLTTLGDSYSDVKGTMEDVNNVKYSDVTDQIAEIKRTLQVDFFEPIMNQILPVVRDQFLPTVKNAFGWIKDNGATVAAVITGIGTAVGIVALQAVGLNGLKTAFMGLSIVQKAVTAAQWLMNAAMAANPIGIIIALIAGLVAAFVVLFKTNDGFRAKVLEVWGAVKDFLSGAVDAIANFFTVTIPNAIDAMVQWFSELPAKIGGFIKTVLTNVKNWATSMATKAREAGSKFVNNVVNFVKNLPAKVWGYLKSVVSRVASWASELAAKGRAAAKALFNAVVNKIKEIPDKIADVGGNLVKGIWNGISGGLGWIKDKISGWVGNVTSFIKRLFGIKSPSTVMRDEVGKYLAQGIGVGFESEMPATLRAMQASMSGAVDSLKSDVALSTSGIAADTLAANAASGGMFAGGANGSKNIVFNQYNNSPKALDRLSIYRQTKSVLFSAKVGLANV